MGKTDEEDSNDDWEEKCYKTTARENLSEHGANYKTATKNQHIFIQVRNS